MHNLFLLIFQGEVGVGMPGMPGLKGAEGEKVGFSLATKFIRAYKAV